MKYQIQIKVHCMRFQKKRCIIYCKRCRSTNKFCNEVTQELAKARNRRKRQELDAFKANCVSYMICKKYGIDVFKL